jgi:hypothetical protein
MYDEHLGDGFNKRPYMVSKCLGHFANIAATHHLHSIHLEEVKNPEKVDWICLWWGKKLVMERVPQIVSQISGLQPAFQSQTSVGVFSSGLYQLPAPDPDLQEEDEPHYEPPC